MTRDEIREMALSSGLIDPDLSSDDQMVADYGECEKAILAFVAMIVKRLAAGPSVPTNS